MFKRTLLCTAAVLFAAGLGMAAPQTATKSASWSGYVMDQKCSSMGMKMATDAACIKKCVDGGSPLVLYDTANKKVYNLDPQSAVTEHAAHHVRIHGTLDGDTIHVTSVTMYPARHTTTPTN